MSIGTRMFSVRTWPCDLAAVRRGLRNSLLSHL